MEGAARIGWLKRILLFKTALCLFVWGLPTLLAPAAFLAIFGLNVPDDPVSITLLRLFGALATALTLLYWSAYKDPVKNRAIIKYAILDNGLATLTIIGLGLTVGIISWFIWVSAGLTTFFFISFLVLLPKAE